MLEESPLIALAQLILKTLGVFFEKPCGCSVADPVYMRVCSPGSSLQLPVIYYASNTTTLNVRECIKGSITYSLQ